MARLWDYLDGELTPHTCDAVRNHLSVCSACLPHAKFAEQFLEALGRCKNTAPAMPGSLRDRVMATLKSEGF